MIDMIARTLSKLRKCSVIIILFVCLCRGFGDERDDADRQEMLDEFVPQLYSKYMNEVDRSDGGTVSFRRILKNNKVYSIHVNKLKDVNGLKRHNLIVKEDSDDNPLIYIVNPLETKVPNAYLNVNNLKDELTDRVLRQRKEFHTKHEKTVNPISKFLKINYGAPDLVQNKYVDKDQNLTHERKLSKDMTQSKNISNNITSTTNTLRYNITTAKLITNKRVITIKTKLPKRNFTSKPTLLVDGFVFNLVKTKPLDHKVNRINTNNAVNEVKNISSISIVSNENIKRETDTTETVLPIKNIILRQTDKNHSMTDTFKSPINIPHSDSNYNAEVSQKEKTTHEITLTDVKQFTNDNVKRAVNNITVEVMKENSYSEKSSAENMTYATNKNTNEEPTTDEFTSSKPTTIGVTTNETTGEELNTFESITEEITNEPSAEVTALEISTEESTTKKMTTTATTIAKKTKRTKLSKPLVFMGDWNN